MKKALVIEFRKRIENVDRKAAMHIARQNLLEAKASVAEAHDSLRNLELNKEADKVYELLEQLNKLIRRFNYEL